MNLKLPRGYSNSRNLNYSRTAGIRNGGSFKPLGETVCELGVESTVGSFIQTPPHTSDFWNSRIREYSRTAGMSSRGSFITLGETACNQRVESLWRRVMNLRDSRGYSIPKIWTISESREF